MVALAEQEEAVCVRSGRMMVQQAAQVALAEKAV